MLVSLPPSIEWSVIFWRWPFPMPCRKKNVFLHISTMVVTSHCDTFAFIWILMSTIFKNVIFQHSLIRKQSPSTQNPTHPSLENHAGFFILYNVQVGTACYKGFLWLYHSHRLNLVYKIAHIQRHLMIMWTPQVTLHYTVVPGGVLLMVMKTTGMMQ